MTRRRRRRRVPVSLLLEPPSGPHPTRLRGTKPLDTMRSDSRGGRGRLRDTGGAARRSPHRLRRVNRKARRAAIAGGAVLTAIIVLALVVKFRWKAGIEEIMLALFTGFVVTWFFTTITGAFFRGPSQLLNWPWAHPNGYNPLDDLL